MFKSSHKHMYMNECRSIPTNLYLQSRQGGQDFTYASYTADLCLDHLIPDRPVSIVSFLFFKKFIIFCVCHFSSFLSKF